MQEKGISSEVIASNNSHKGTSELSGGSSLPSPIEGAQSNTASLLDSVDHQMKVDSTWNNNSLGNSEDATVDLTCSTKRQKLDEPQAVQSVSVEATEGSVLDWLKNFKDGVSF